MDKLATHPSREELHSYSLGQLPEERAVAIDSHISDCKPCCETIVQLSSEDTFVGLLKEARESPTDQTLDHDSLDASSFESTETIPRPLAEHPRYEVISLVGKGGMGRVYQARHRMMDRSVALKVINREWIRKAEVIDRFHREVKTAASLDHPNIVTSHDAEQADDLHFLVMEFVDGVDLSKTVKQRGPLPIAEACDFIRQAAEGLQYAHDRGMVHRDIKPHNLMVTQDNVVKILDFGLASLTPQATPDEPISEDADGNLTIAGAIMGTPDFISPEQALDARKVDGRSDIYSLGATLYYLLSGRVPFAEGSVMHKLKSHAQVEPDSLKTLRNELPDELVAIVSKMMAKDPDERYLTPSKVADALESFLRTWQPDGANSPGKLLLGGGDIYESGGQSSGAVDAGRDWLLVIARVLFAISLVPVALLVYETWAFDRTNPDVGAGYRTSAYMLVTLCLSTIAGIASAVHRLNPARSPSNRRNRRLFKMTASEVLTVAAILIVGCLALGLYYTNGSIGGIRVEVTAPEDIGSLGTHPLTIVDTSGEKPLGGTTSTHQDDTSGITTHSFKSANGRYNITLVEKVLTVNGKEYLLQNPTDSIRIADDRVEIASVLEQEQVGKEELKRLQGRWYVAAFTQGGRKEFAAEKGVGMQVQFKGDMVTSIQSMPNGEKASKVWGRIELDSKTNPKSIDIVNPDSPGGRLLGIYELADNDLQICFAERTNVDDAEGRPVTRPTTFDAPAGSEMVLLECRRAVEDPDLNQLQGDWEAVAVTEGGKQLSTEEAFGSLLLQIEGSKFAVTETKPNGSQSEPDTGQLEICSTINPKTIDFIDGDGSNKRSIGIYELNDGVLKICVAETGGHDSLPGESIPEVKRPKRPTTFDSPAGSNMILMEFRRKQPDESANSSNERVDTTPAAEQDEKQPARLSIQEQQHSRDQEIFSFMYENIPELQKSTAESFIARGDYEGAKRVLSSVQPADPKATAALEIAKIQEQKGEIEKAADSTIEAIRLTPSLLSDEQLPLIKKAGRVHQLVEVLTEERLSKLGYNNRIEAVVKALLNDEATRTDGFELLTRVSAARSLEYWQLLRDLPQDLLNENPDPAPLLRKTLIPTDFAAEDAGWERFGLSLYFSGEDNNNYKVWGPLQGLPPIIHGNAHKNAALNTVLREVENKLEQHPGWKAGVAVLGYLQAELGNEQLAVALFEKALAEKDSPMPPNSAWAFALVLEGKGKTLDQMAMRLYERKIAGPTDNGRPWRYWPSKDLADLYARYGRPQEARELLFVLAEPETAIVCTPGYKNSNVNSCVQCHKTDRSFSNFTLLSSKLTDIGYPVDAYLQLARIDASYHNLASSDAKWANQNAQKYIRFKHSTVSRINFNGNFPESGRYLNAKNKAVKGITPSAVLQALKEGRFTNQGKYSDDLDLAVSVRGEGGKPTVFSPVVELFSLATQAKGDQAAVVNVQIDQFLSEAFEKDRGNIETGIAATIFAFLREDIEEAKKRTQLLSDSIQGANFPPNGITLWLVARYALANEGTKALGEQLANRALAEVEGQSDPLLKDAIQQEWQAITGGPKRE